LASLKNKIDAVVVHLVRKPNNPRAVRLFFRALIVLTFFKIVLLWPLSHDVIAHHTMSLPQSWFGKLVFGPSFLANYNVDVFFSIAIIFLFIAFFRKPHLSTTALFFWLAFNLYVIYLPFANGADIVLFMLAFWCIPTGRIPAVNSDYGRIIQAGCFNSATILCKIQVVLIYLVSGWDKLINESWRSGEAFDYVTHMNTMFNPAFSRLFDQPEMHLTLSWATILFELSFVILIWFEKTRLPILAIGICFHIFIWIVMSLPDFAITMMVSYVIFLKDADLTRLKAFKPFSKGNHKLKQ
jgi:hypothetical protein